MLGADSGLDLVRRARENGATLPILMLSALSDVEHRTAGLEAGADDYVVKPFSFDELVARLRVQERRATSQRPQPAILTADRVLQTETAKVSLTSAKTTFYAFSSPTTARPCPAATSSTHSGRPKDRVTKTWSTSISAICARNSATPILLSRSRRYATKASS